ncbi:MAG: hypothetical protein ACOCV2_05870 [Persicimonas sp.]
MAALALAGCQADGDETGEQVEPWTYESDRAPYALEVPAGWEEEEAEALNRTADLALGFNDRFFAIVIPQELPSFDGVEPPDALDMKRASVDILEGRIDDFEVTSEGPNELDGQSALSVIARGRDGEQRVQYVNTYLTRNDWGYQIVVWGRQSDSDDLEEAADELLSGWRFADSDEPSSEDGQN